MRDITSHATLSKQDLIKLDSCYYLSPSYLPESPQFPSNYLHKEVFLDYPGGPKLITEAVKISAFSKKLAKEEVKELYRRGDVRRIWFSTAGFEDRGHHKAQNAGGL